MTQHHTGSSMPKTPTLRTALRRRALHPSIAGAVLALVAVAGASTAAALPTDPGARTLSSGPVSVSTAAAAPNASSPLGSRAVVGALGDVTTLEQRTGTTIADHNYADFAGNVPQGGRMVTAGSSASWAQVAATQPGSKLYNDIVRWALTLKTRGTIFFAFQHEPETTSNMSKGTPAQFQAAFQRVVSIMRGQGATNLLYTWQMTAWSFRTSTSARDYAAKFYPGDASVDVVGADAYNWNVCGQGRAKQVELSTLGNPVLAFARAHGKKAALPEYASHTNSLRAAWLDNAHTWMVANKSTLIAGFYFNRPPTNSNNNDCRWTLTTSAEYAAFGRIAKDTANFTP